MVAQGQPVTYDAEAGFALLSFIFQSHFTLMAATLLSVSLSFHSCQNNILTFCESIFNNQCEEVSNNESSTGLKAQVLLPHLFIPRTVVLVTGLIPHTTMT